MFNSIWYKGNIKWRKESILDTDHGKKLNKLAKDIRHLKTADLGAGNQGASEIFTDYEGYDLPGFNVYTDDLYFLYEYEVVYMGAFIDVMQFPLEVLDKVLSCAKNYVLIHRQEFTDDPTGVTQEPAYGGWTWHSKINNIDFVKTVLGFRIVKTVQLDFDNWEKGGHSILLQKL